MERVRQLTGHLTAAAAASPRLLELQVADDPASWRAAGFEVEEPGVVWLGDVCVRLVGKGAEDSSGSGITGWVIDGLPADEAVHGIPNNTSSIVHSSRSGPCQHHRNSVTEIDHIVISSPDLARTEAEMRDKLGLFPLRTRAVPKTSMVQVFYRLGSVVLEVVGQGGGQGSPGDCSFWGLALRVDNIDQTKEVLADGVGRVKRAVQGQGRRITTLRGQKFGISVHTAFISGKQADRSN